MSRCRKQGLADTKTFSIGTQRAVRGICRVPNYFGIASSSVAGLDIDERGRGWIIEWAAQVETIVESEKPINFAERNIATAERGARPTSTSAFLNDDWVQMCVITTSGRSYVYEVKLSYTTEQL